MNAGLQNSTHPSLIYYDGDYPSKYYSKYPENFDEIVPFQGLAYDIDKYLQLANELGNNVLELCCGTGRVCIPLAMEGNKVTAVDFAPPLLKQLNDKLNSLPENTAENLTIIEADITDLDLKTKNFDLVICAFNSLLCITSFEKQQRVLNNAATHLRKGGMLALDLMNPFILNFGGDSIPKPFFTRKNPATGNVYTRFAAMGPMQTNQNQKLFGWYDEVEPDGTLKRQLYEMYWRPVFRYEIELMLNKAGFKIAEIFGGHQNEPFTPTSRKMFILAIKK